MKLFKQIQVIYEILSPDVFLYDYIKKYKLLIQIYEIIYQIYSPEAEKEKLRRDILKKTGSLIKKYVELRNIIDTLPLYKINKDIARTIKSDQVSERVKIANLYKSLRSYIEKNKKRMPYLVSLAERIEEIITQLRERQKSVELALEEIVKMAEEIAEAEEEQKKSGLSKEEFSHFWVLKKFNIKNAKEQAKAISELFRLHENWTYNINEERTLRRKLYKILLKTSKDTQIVKIVNTLLKIDKLIKEEVE